MCQNTKRDTVANNYTKNKTRAIKLQGVETPSQVRYMYYFEELLKQQKCYSMNNINGKINFNNKMKVLRAPDVQRVQLSHIKSESFWPHRNICTSNESFSISGEIRAKRYMLCGNNSYYHYYE